MRLSVALFAALALSGCAHELSSDERLERETSTVSVLESPDALELQKVSCKDAPAELAKARNVNRPETDRLQDYERLFTSLLAKTKKFEQAMTRNPDLEFQEGSQKFAAAKELCVQHSADVRVEFDRYVRDLVDLPTVQEIKGGTTVTVARLNFDVLKGAITTLDPEDKDTLLARVSAAEKKISAAAAEKRRK